MSSRRCSFGNGIPRTAPAELRRPHHPKNGLYPPLEMRVVMPRRQPIRVVVVVVVLVFMAVGAWPIRLLFRTILIREWEIRMPFRSLPYHPPPSFLDRPSTRTTLRTHHHHHHPVVSIIVVPPWTVARIPIAIAIAIATTNPSRSNPPRSH